MSQLCSAARMQDKLARAMREKRLSCLTDDGSYNWNGSHQDIDGLFPASRDFVFSTPYSEHPIVAARDLSCLHLILNIPLCDAPAIQPEIWSPDTQRQVHSWEDGLAGCAVHQRTCRQLCPSGHHTIGSQIVVPPARGIRRKRLNQSKCKCTRALFRPNTKSILLFTY